MSTKKEAVESVETTAAPKFSIKKLRENCMKLFGVTTSTFDGATYGLNDEYTVEEMKKTIETWQKTSIKKEDK